jgi:hypothetical protein
LDKYAVVWTEEQKKAHAEAQKKKPTKKKEKADGEEEARSGEE